MVEIGNAVNFRTASSYLSAKALFSLSLIVATTIPFVAGGMQWVIGKTPVFPLEAIIGFLAGLHVPLTVYLLFDRNIRHMMRQRPVALIFIPIFIFAACFLIYFSMFESRANNIASPLVYFSIFVLSWNIWHFGKQNIGVYSFFRRAQDQSGMLPVEKKLILVGSVLGVMTTFGLAGEQYIKQFAANVNFDILINIYKYVELFGSFFSMYTTCDRSMLLCL